MTIRIGGNDDEPGPDPHRGMELEVERHRRWLHTTSTMLAEDREPEVKKIIENLEHLIVEEFTYNFSINCFKPESMLNGIEETVKRYTGMDGKVHYMIGDQPRESYEELLHKLRLVRALLK